MKSSSHDSISSVFAYHSIILLLVHDIILEDASLPKKSNIYFGGKYTHSFLIHNGKGS